MGIARTLGKSFGILLFMLFVSSCILAMVASHFTDYSTIKPLFVSILADAVKTQYSLDEEKLQQAYSTLSAMCQDKSSVEMPLGDKKILVDCAALKGAGAGGMGKLIATAMVGSMFDDIYYAEYDCSFLECLKSGRMLVVASARGNNAFRLAQNFSIAGIALGALLIFVLSRGWPERLKSFGIPLIIIGLPSVALPSLENWAVTTALPSIGISALAKAVDIKPLISGIFSYIQAILLLVFAFGIALTACGCVSGWREKKRVQKKQVQIKPLPAIKQKKSKVKV